MTERAAVVDSGPLVALAGIGHLELLDDLFEAVYVPDAVFREVVEAGAGKLGARDLEQATWIHRVRLRQRPDPLLARELGAGEAEVITFATQNGITRVLLDDRRARRVAKIAYELRVQGTVGVLSRAKRRDAIRQLRPLLERIRENGYYLSDALVEAACRDVGE